MNSPSKINLIAERELVDHTHGEQCGHVALVHDGHIGYLVDGKLNCVVEDGTDF
jgi:hypothetical protein